MSLFGHLCTFLVFSILNATATNNLPFIFKHHNHSDVAAPVSRHHAPCTNFYAYSCTPWLTQAKKPPFEPIWNPWVATAHRLKRRLSKILTRHDPSLLNPRIFYTSCLHIVEHENKYLRELVSLVENLGGWPLIGRQWAESNYDWLDQLAKVTRNLEVYPMLKIHADLDYDDPKKVLIYVEPGNLIFPGFILTGSGYGPELEAYEKWILESASHLFNVTGIDIGDVKKIVKFEMSLAKLMGVKSRNERTTIGKLSMKFAVDWLKPVKNIFGGFFEITPNTTIAVKNVPFLKNLFLLIDKTGVRTVSNYLIWSVVKELSRDTTNHMRDLNFLIDQAILGVKSDLTPEYECLDKTITYFSPLLVPRYLKLYQKPKTFTRVKSMFDSIKTEFIDNLNKSDWLSKEAKLLSIKKVKNIQLNLGYPSNCDFQKLQMTGDHFTNILKLRKNKMTQTLSQLCEKNPATVWPSTAFDVNAYYSILQNSIFIPLPLLELPFFDNDRDDFLNYGSLGFLIAHEMSHSLDPTGILADPNGKIGKWWPKNDLKIYEKRIECFGSDGTIGEKIADENGLKISLGAVRKRKPNEKINKFFISFAQMWCETSEDTDIFATEEHSPNLNRVQSLLNNNDFSQSFGCDSGAACDLW